MTDPVTNTALAARLSSLVNRWDRRENQMIDFISQPSGTVIVTDGVNVDHELPSFPQLQADVGVLTDTLTGAVAQAQDINSVSVALLNETSAGVATIDASLAAATTAADAAQASQTAATDSASQTNTHKNAAAASASTATDQADIASGAMEIATDAADIAVTERTAAQAAAATAQQYATRASEWANKAPNVAIEDGEYSARHWAQQAQVAATGAMHYKGAWSAAEGQYPDNPATGHLYVVSEAGTVDGVTYAISDQIVYNGSQWEKIENTQSVTSVAGKTGAVVLDAGDLQTGILDVARIPTLAMDKVDGLNTALDGKAPGAHLHATADIPGLQGKLDGKAPVGHDHGWNDISGKPAQATRWPKWSEVTEKPALNYLLLSGGTLTGNLIIEKASAELRLKSTAPGGREIALLSNGTPRTGLFDVTNNRWLMRIDIDNSTHFAGQVHATGGFAGTVQNAGGVVSIRKMTQAAYNALTPKDANTLYIVT